MYRLATSEYRWVPVLFGVLPLSKLHAIYTSMKESYSALLHHLCGTSHNTRATQIVQQVKEMQTDDKEMCTARPGFQSMSLFEGTYKQTMNRVDLSSLNHIIDINTSSGILHVEPMVGCNRLIDALEKQGMMLPIVPELGDLTVGGLVMGFGIETSSFKYGLFHQICLEYELLLPNGDVVTCTKENRYSELYHAIPWSRGTIGFLLSVKVQILPMKKYCMLQYTPFTSRGPLLEALELATRGNGNDFVECIMYDRNSGVLLTGILTDDVQEPGSLHQIGRFWSLWFYKHVESVLKNGFARREYIPLKDYYKRHQRSLFWEMGDILPFGNHWLFRYTLGWLMPPKVSFLKASTPQSLHELQKKNHVIEDYLVPMSELATLLNWLNGEIDFYPLWICPYKSQGEEYGFTNVNPNTKNEPFYVDVGVYGVPERARSGNFNHTSFHERAEGVLRMINGYKGLYAQTHQSKEEFEVMFNHKEYRRVREKYSCVGKLPEVYDKVYKGNRV